MTSSVVVVSHRPHRWLVPCLESVVGQADEVVVIDNGSPDGAVSDTARRLGARVIRLPRNLGFAAGVNVGVRNTRGDLVALLNDDAFADRNWLGVSGEVLADPNIAAVAPKILFAWPYAEINLHDAPRYATGDPRTFGRCLRQVTLEGREVLSTLIGPGIHRLEQGVQGTELSRWRWTTGREPIYVPLPDDADPGTLRIGGEPAPVTRIVRLVNNAGSYLSAEGYSGDCGYQTPDHDSFNAGGDRFGASGAAMAVRREAFRRVGDFRERFFAYYEDTDWSWRAQLAGLSIRYEPRVIVHHVGGVTSGGPSAELVRFLASRNRIDMLTGNAPLPLAARQIRRAVTDEPANIRRAVLGRLPRSIADRAVLSRRWQLSPRDVWSKWAGVGEQRNHDSAAKQPSTEGVEDKG